jgi:hypothetical protein
MECQERDGSPSRNGGLIAILRLKSGMSARSGRFSPQAPLMQIKLTVISVLKRTFLPSVSEITYKTLQRVPFVTYFGIPPLTVEFSLFKEQV